MKELLKQIAAQCAVYTKQGRVATYIPELSNADPDKLGICVFTENAEE